MNKNTTKVINIISICTVSIVYLFILIFLNNFQPETWVAQLAAIATFIGATYGFLYFIGVVKLFNSLILKGKISIALLFITYFAIIMFGINSLSLGENTETIVAVLVSGGFAYLLSCIVKRYSYST